MTDSFPRQQARTQRFTPRRPPLVPDLPGRQPGRVPAQPGRRPTRSPACGCSTLAPGRNAWSPTRPRSDAAARHRPAQEKARRERTREQAGGIVGVRHRRGAATVAVFALAGRVYLAGPGRHGGRAARGAIAGPAARPFDPRPDPAGQRVAYVSARRAAGRSTWPPGADTVIDRRRDEPSPGLTLSGLAEFVAAEEMGRLRGYWWAPDGTAAARGQGGRDARSSAGTSPTRPTRTARPAEVGYPAAGTPNADVSLLLARLDGSQAAGRAGTGPRSRTW